MKLVIVESPAKCKKIESFLGNEYKCLASFGHIRELTNGLKCIDIQNNFEPTFTIMESKTRNIKTLKKFIKKADEIIIATDDDREGEAIGWHICKTFNLPTQTTKRIIFREITKSAVKKAITNPGILNMQKIYAQLARQILDRLVGFIVSPQLWKSISRNTKQKLSAGRCQSPALKIIYDNQTLIDNTPGVKVYNTKGNFTKHNLDFALNKEILNQEDMVDFLEESVKFEHKVKKVNELTNKRKIPPSPLTTSKLQQRSSNILHMSPKQTMMTAQKLYEAGYITYMRTDSTTYSKEFIEKSKHFIISEWGKEYINKNINNLSLRKGKGQEAHEAIRPTKVLKRELPANTDTRQKRLYELIWKNTVESCMADSLYNLIQISLLAPKKYKYNYSEQKIIFPGWLILEDYNKNNELYSFIKTQLIGDILPYNKIYSEFTLKNIKTHFTEARLVQQLEEKGIGRPSTFSGLVSKILERGYVKKMDIEGKKLEYKDFELKEDEISEISGSKIFGNEKNKLKIQPIGIIVCEFLYKNYDNLFNFEYTSKMENSLDIISKGEKIWYDLCSECYSELKKLTNGIDNKREVIKIDENHTYMIAKYGPVIKYEKDGETKFMGIRDDVDINLLRQGKYKLKDIMKDDNFSGKNLGNFKNLSVILKKGKYGLYINWNNKNYSIKHIKKTEKNIKLEDVLDVLLGEKVISSNIIKEVTDEISVRKGKYGPYLFYKTKTMKKPKFINLKGKEWRDASQKVFESWVKSEVQ